MILESSMSHCNLVSVCSLYFRIFHMDYSEITSLISCCCQILFGTFIKSSVTFGGKLKSGTHTKCTDISHCVFVLPRSWYLCLELWTVPMSSVLTLERVFYKQVWNVMPLFYRHLFPWHNSTTVKKKILCQVFQFCIAIFFLIQHTVYENLVCSVI